MKTINVVFTEVSRYIVPVEVDDEVAQKMLDGEMSEDDLFQLVDNSNPNWFKECLDAVSEREFEDCEDVTAPPEAKPAEAGEE